MENLVNDLLEQNPFAKAFEEFDEDAFFKDLHNQVKDLPYFQKYKGFKNMVNYLSYLFNVASALTASYAVYYLISWVTGIPVIGSIVAVVFLYFLEKLKRKSSSEFWQVYFFKRKFASGWFALSFGCFLISAVSSGFGVKQGTESHAPRVELIQADSTAQWYRAEILKLDAQIGALQAQKDRKSGITLYKLAPAITNATNTVTAYRQRLQELERQTAGENSKLKSEYMEELKITAWMLVGITLFCELCFVACIAYVWYYYHRSYIERAKTKGKQKRGKEGQATTELEDRPSPTLSPEMKSIQNMIARLSKEIEELKSQPNEGALFTDYPPPQKKILENRNSPPLAKYGQDVNDSVQVGTDVYTEEIDRFTIPHTYNRGNKRITAHYTLPQIRARVGQYSRGIEEAERGNLDEEVTARRKAWLAYWQEKESELTEKMKEGIG